MSRNWRSPLEGSIITCPACGQMTACSTMNGDPWPGVCDECNVEVTCECRGCLLASDAASATQAGMLTRLGELLTTPEQSDAQVPA